MITGFILAGGNSSRMGHDKSLLAVGSRRLIEVVMERLAPQVERLLVIGNAHNVHQLRELAVDGVLLDLKPDYGPLMGIYTGLMHTETPLNLFVPCDMPWIEGRLIEQLVSACYGGLEVVAGVHPLEGIQPFPLLCNTNACRTIGALLDKGERSLQSLLCQPDTRLIRIDEPELWRSFTNVNTLADYACLRRAGC